MKARGRRKGDKAAFARLWAKLCHLGAGNRISLA